MDLHVKMFKLKFTANNKKTINNARVLGCKPARSHTVIDHQNQKC